MVEYYGVLQVTKTASAAEIRRAYRNLALKWHPDKNKDNHEEADKKFKEISEAYEVLSDVNKRRVYDRYGKKGLINGGIGARSRSTHHNHHMYSDFDFEFGSSEFQFRDPQEMFKNFFGNWFPFTDVTESSNRQADTRKRGNRLRFGFNDLLSRSSDGKFSMFNSLDLYDYEIHIIEPCDLFQTNGPPKFRNIYTTVKVVDGKNMSFHRVVEDGKETVIHCENNKPFSLTVNGIKQTIVSDR